MKVPLDLFVNIVDELAACCDHASLKNLCQTCTEMVPLCQRVLFSRISFSGSNNKARVAAFDKLLTQSPHIIEYVYSFEYGIENGDLTGIISYDVLFKLRHLHDLHLHPSVSVTGAIDWRAIRHTLTSVISNILSSPSLTRLHLVGMHHIPLAVLEAASTNLQDLDLESVQVDVASPEDIDPDNLPRRPSVPRISTYSAQNGVSQPSAVLLGINGYDHTPIYDFSCLERLTIEWSILPDISVTDHLMRTSLSLKSFQCTVLYPLTFTGLSNVMLDASSSTLKCLTVTVSFTNLTDLLIQDDPYIGLCQELQSLSQRNVLEYFRLSVNLPVSAVNLDHKLRKLGSLDEVLTREAFPCLRSVDLMFKIWGIDMYSPDAMYPEDEDIDRLCQAQFPKLSSAEALEFHCFAICEL